MADKLYQRYDIKMITYLGDVSVSLVNSAFIALWTSPCVTPLSRPLPGTHLSPDLSPARGEETLLQDFKFLSLPQR